MLAIHSAITIAALRLRISQSQGFSLIDGASDSIGGFLDAIETEFLARAIPLGKRNWQLWRGSNRATSNRRALACWVICNRLTN